MSSRNLKKILIHSELVIRSTRYKTPSKNRLVDLHFFALRRKRKKMNFDKSKIGFKQNQKTQIVDRALPFPMTPCSAHKTFPSQSYALFKFLTPKKTPYENAKNRRKRSPSDYRL